MENSLIDFTNTLRVLDEYRNAVIALYREKLRSDDHIATGDLINNITYIINKDSGSVEVSLKLQDYWKYVENDTKPHFPPISAILEWVKVKKLVERARTYDGKLPTEKQLAFLVARKISEVGTEGTHDLRETMQKVNAEYEQKIGDAITQDLNDAMISIITEFQMR